MSERALGRRGGFTLVEMLLAFAIFGVIFAAALGMMGNEVKSFTRANESTGTLQNARFSVDELERNIRAAGVGLTQGQPMLVYADANTIVVNGDYLSRTLNDTRSIFVDTAATDAITIPMAMSASTYRLPGTAFRYPVVAYGGYAETIMFFFRPDSTTARTDDYILFRQVNYDTAQVVARDLLRNGSAPFFQYLHLVSPLGAAAYLDSVRAAALPVYHASPLHNAPGDTALSALSDSVRAVRVSFIASNGVAPPNEVRRAVTRLIRMPNAGLETFNTCGDVPSTPGGFDAQNVVTGTGAPAVQLTWNASADEAGGEKDVVRYVVFRAEGAVATFGDPFLSIASGAATYTYVDTQVTSGTQYWYAVAAQDCTPNVGSQTTPKSVSVP